MSFKHLYDNNIRECGIGRNADNRYYLSVYFETAEEKRRSGIPTEYEGVNVFSTVTGPLFD